MLTAPSSTSVALLLGLSFFLGLAFEDFFAGATHKCPGGIRTFPMLALAGGMLYLLEPAHGIAFTAGLLVLGAWLAMYYRTHLAEPDETGEAKANLIVPALNVHAYLLGAIALALPPWVAVTTTVAAVLLLTGRTWLHDTARRIDMKEIVTAGQFLILTGIVLPLLPNEPVTALTSITPRQVWLALVVVCTFSYVSYLAQRYWAAAAGGLWMAALGGLYSSTATTVVLARRDGGQRRHRLVGQQRQNNSSQDQKLAGGDDLLHIDPPRQVVQPGAPGQEQHRRHRRGHRDPGRQRQGDGAEQISVNVEQRHNEIGFCLAGLVRLRQLRAVVDDEPGAEHEEAGGEGNAVRRLEQIEHAAGEREHRKRANAAGALLRDTGEEILEREAEEKAQAQKQGHAGRRRCCEHDGAPGVGRGEWSPRNE
jgi:hypothetical protein